MATKKILTVGDGDIPEAPLGVQDGEVWPLLLALFGPVGRTHSCCTPDAPSLLQLSSRNDILSHQSLLN